MPTSLGRLEIPLNTLPLMSPHGIIATIASTLRSSTKPSHSATAEDERLLTGPSAIRGKQPETSTEYGTSSWPDDPVDAAQRARRESEETANLRDDKDHGPGPLAADDDEDRVWKGVETLGLDGTGSVNDEASVKGDREEPPTRDRFALTRTPYSTLVLEHTLLLPLLVALCIALFLTLAHYAWPPLGDHQGGDQGTSREAYPHPFAWKPLWLGILAGLAARSVRPGIGVVIEECLGQRSSAQGQGRRMGSRIATISISTVLHTTLMEGVRLLLLSLLDPSSFHIGFVGSIDDVSKVLRPPASTLLQTSFHAGIGFGTSEAGWGIAHGWAKGLLPYRKVLTKHTKPDAGFREIHRIRSISSASSHPDETRHCSGSFDRNAANVDLNASSDPDEGHASNDTDMETGAEADLVEKVEALEDMRARAELETALGIPWPNINFALHVLWRLDTILINLGFTLISAAFYYNPEPLYRKHGSRPGDSDKGPMVPISQPSRWLPLVVAGIIVIHSLVSLTWSLSVKRLGLGAMTWGSLILSLMALFAGLGCWGALV